MMPAIFHAFLVAVSAFANGEQFVRQDDLDPRDDERLIDRITESIRSQRPKPDAFLLEYSVEPQDAKAKDTKAKDAKSMDAKSIVEPSEKKVSFHVAAWRANYCYTENKHHYHNIPPHLDDNFHRVDYKDGILRVYYPNQRVLELSPNSDPFEFAMKARRPLILECMAWWPDEDIDLAKGMLPIDLERTLTNRIYISIESKSDLNPSCTIQAKTGDTLHFLWDSSSSNWVLDWREYRSLGKGRTEARFEFADYRVVDGRWNLPHRMRRILYDPSREKGTVLHETMVNLLRASSLESEVEQTRIQPAPGTLITDRTTGATIQQEGGMDLMEEVLDRERELGSYVVQINPTVNRVSTHSTVSTASNWARQFQVPLIAVLGGCFGYFLTVGLRYFHRINPIGR